jgi:TonB-dependent receptor
MYKTQSFKKKILVTAVASVAMSGFMAPAFAQEEDTEVVITGIRASLERSMDQKREASGVQDVITAEDIGKFPDTNLAESMQRIPGVSINREGGEGSRVTVRGLDSSYNLVTHNGRTIAKTTGDRSFNFADMAAELVAGVAVYKTGNATVNSGGMGATVDMKSIRPLSNPGQKIVLNAKMISDTSWAGGDTPEVFGLYSNTFNDDEFGVSVAVGYQKRESSLARAHIDNGWTSASGASSSNADSPDFGIYSRPQSARYKFEVDERERMNGQLVAQWAPTDNIKATLDFDTYERSVYSDRNEVSAWFTYPGAAHGVWTTNNGVSTPLIYSETYKPIGNTTAAPNDLSMAGGHFAHKYEGDSIGVNVEWAQSDRLKFVFDLAHSEATDRPDHGLGSDVNLSTAAYTRTSTTIDTTGEIFSVINGGGDATAAQMRITGSSFQNNISDSEVDQYQVKGNFEINEESNIDFGISSTEVYNRFRNTNVQQNNWGGLGVAGQMTAAFSGTSTSALSRFDGAFGNFSDASGLVGGSTLADGTNLSTATRMDNFFDWDLSKVQPLAHQLYNTTASAGLPYLGECPNGAVSAFCSSTEYERGTDRATTETTDAIYVQYNFARDAFKADVGLRYETTDVTSDAAFSLFTGANWASDTEIVFTGQTFGYITRSSDYDHVLPNLDLSYEVNDDVVLRASVSKTIARPAYDQITSGVSINGNNFPRTRGYAQGVRGNANLVPYESRNLDLSFEWYYNDSSYLSVTGFTKTVSNFIANKTIRYDGIYTPEMTTAIHDPFAGVYTQEAIAALPSGASGQEIRNWIFNNRNGQPGVTDTTPGDTTDFAGNIVGLTRDPLVRFDISEPTNSGDDREIQGLEFALQHMFGESGFGTIVNYTMVSSDLSWDTSRLSQDQRPLLGVSDSANLIGFYDNNGWNVRVAYNWRDKFLNAYNDAGGSSPEFVAAYAQIDLGVSYQITDNLKVSLDGINVTEEAYELVARNGDQVARRDEYGGRWMLGVGYSF